MPAAPSWLKGHGLAEWKRVAPTLWLIGTLTELDASQLAAYCEAFGKYRQAVEDFQKMADQDPLTHAAMMKTQGGNYIQTPLLGTINALRKYALALAAEFGLTPSARTQIEAYERGGSADPMARKYGLR